jgi:DNA-binding SARP family transcriptional activator
VTRHDVEFLVLGPLAVMRGGAEIAVGGLKARRVLGALLVDVNHPVSIDRMAWVVWGDHQPSTATGSIHAYVSRLRHLLGEGSISRVDHHYVLHAECTQVDSCRFESMIAGAEILLEDEPKRALDLIRGALGLWRGEPFGDLACEDFAHLEAIRLNELRLSTVELAVEAEISVGLALDAVARLQALVEEHPLRERLWFALVRGLCHVDRRPEAVEAFDRYRKVLRRHGLEPRVELGDLLRL